MSDAEDSDDSGSYEESFDSMDFDSGVVRFILFSLKNGKKEPDSRNDSSGERSLAMWRSNILQSKDNNMLNADHEAVLASIGFKFPTTRSDVFDMQFDQMYSALLKWKVKTGADHLLVPRSAKVDGNNIGKCDQFHAKNEEEVRQGREHLFAGRTYF